MLVAYVLRLVPAALAEGRLAGTVQFVETGQTSTFRSLEEMVALLLPQPRDGEPPQTIDLRGVAESAESSAPPP